MAIRLKLIAEDKQNNTLHYTPTDHITIIKEVGYSLNCE